jgi:hypothetical protein
LADGLLLICRQVGVNVAGRTLGGGEAYAAKKRNGDRASAN